METGTAGRLRAQRRTLSLSFGVSGLGFRSLGFTYV